jgi:hypothetical protein
MSRSNAEFENKKKWPFRFILRYEGSISPFPGKCKLYFVVYPAARRTRPTALHV